MTVQLVNKRVNWQAGLNVRSIPSTAGGKIGGLNNGDGLQVIDGLTAQGSGYPWQAVILPTQNTMIGWVASAIGGAATLADVAPAPAAVTKVGAHFMGTLTEGEIRAALALKATVYKVVDNVALAQRIHAEQPKATIIFRRYRPDGYWLDKIQQSGVEGAVNAYLGERSTDFVAMPWAYHESDNEVGAPDGYLAFEALRAQKMGALGFRACVLNIQTANTNADVWARADKAGLLRAVESGDHLIGVHTYSQTYMSNNYANSYVSADGQWHGEIFPASVSNDGWTALRYRKDIADVTALGYTRARFVGTETGLDDLVQPGNGVYYLYGEKTRGWKTCEGVWRRAGNLEGRSAPQFYRDQLTWYGVQMGYDARMVGATIFSHGSDDPRWADFDTRPVFL